MGKFKTDRVTDRSPAAVLDLFDSRSVLPALAFQVGELSVRFRLLDHRLGEFEVALRRRDIDLDHFDLVFVMADQFLAAFAFQFGRMGAFCGVRRANV